MAESVAGGHLSCNERMMIENVLNLEEKSARRVMIPRPDIVYLSLARPFEENLRLARQAGHTRFPLCEDDLSTVVGMIHVKDVFRSGAIRTAGPISANCQEDSLSPGNLAARPAFARIPAQPSPPVDAAGRVWQRGRDGDPGKRARRAGWPDPGRIDRETPQITPLGDNIFEVEASCPLDVLAETCGVEIPETDAETAGGLVLDLLGRLAKPGDSVTTNGHRFTVLRADPTRIRKIRLEPFVPEGIASIPGESSQHAGNSSDGA